MQPSYISGTESYGKVKTYVFIPLFFIGLIASIGPFYLWNYNLTAIQLLAFLCFGLWDMRLLKKKGMLIVYFMLFLFYAYSALNQMHGSALFRYIYTFLPFTLYFIGTDSWRKIYKAFNLCFSITLIPSIIVFILVIFVGIDLPSKVIEPLNAGKLYDYQAYPFLVVGNNDQFMRFNGYYDEAGVIGTISGVLLVVNRLNLRDWKNWPVLLGGLLSFSLFFYVLIALYVLLFSSFKTKFFVVAMIILGITYISLDDSIFSELILRRLDFDDGDFVGNNRTTWGFSSFYTRFLHSDQVWFGYGTKYCETIVDVVGCSYKHVVVNQGILMTCVYVLAIEFFYFLKYGLSRNTLILSLLFLSIFYQRPFVYSAIGILLSLAPAYCLEKKL